MRASEERIRRWADGELDPAERQALEAQAARDPQLARRMEAERRLHVGLDALRRTDEPTPPDDLVERCMSRAIQARREEERRRPGLLDWLLRPHTLRVRWGTLLVVAVGASAVVLGWRSRLVETQPDASGAQAVLPAPPPDRPARTPTQSPDGAGGRDEPKSSGQDGVAVRFTLPVGDASSVAVAGDFNAWDTGATLLEDSDGDGVFATTLRLPPGTYAYQFVVDGERWLPDPYASNFRDDGFGNRNSVLRID